MSFVDLRSSAVSLDEVVAAVRHDGAGGVATFLGIVRDENDGRPVVKLEYEAYDAMARAEMRRIADALEAELPGVHVAAVHRVGALGVSDVAIACAASAPHRGEAFAACRKLIDRIKASVPIWKREHGPEGAYWVGWHDARCAADDDGHVHAPGDRE